VKAVRVLVAEDSELFAQTIVEILENDRAFEVCGVAKDGREAVRMTELHRPDVILLDVRMPGMDGLQAIEAIMDRRPTPILVMTADPAGKTGELSFEALRRGALDLVPKPTSWAGTPAEQEDMRQRLSALARIKVVRRRGREATVEVETHKIRGDVPRSAVSVAAATSGGSPLPSLRAVGLVSSTGGPPVLAKILKGLPVDFPFAIVIVQHLSDGFAGRFASWLDQNTALHVELARDRIQLRPGMVLVAPDRYHVVFEGRLTLRLDSAPALGGHRPSGTLMLQSLARSYGRAAIGGVLTGMGEDGAAGLLEIQRVQGHTFVQDEASSIVAGMPNAALSLGATKRVLSPTGIVHELSKLAHGGAAGATT
jgi:two-component system chemotaxis response regulator CheB